MMVTCVSYLHNFPVNCLASRVLYGKCVMNCVPQIKTTFQRDSLLNSIYRRYIYGKLKASHIYICIQHGLVGDVDIVTRRDTYTFEAKDHPIYIYTAGRDNLARYDLINHIIHYIYFFRNDNTDRK